MYGDGYTSGSKDSMVKTEKKVSSSAERRAVAAHNFYLGEMSMSDIRLKLSPPWITYIHQLEALFDGDPQISFYINDSERIITIACNNGDKNAALMRLLPPEKKFGNIIFDIVIDGPVSNTTFLTQKALFDTAFKGNPVYAYSVMPDESGWFFTATYVVFKNCVVQFFNDNLNDCHGIVSTLYQDIAAEVFADADLNGVYYNTDVERGNLGMPLGEWP